MNHTVWYKRQLYTVKYNRFILIMTYIMGDIIIDLQENGVNLRSIVLANGTVEFILIHLIHFDSLIHFIECRRPLNSDKAQKRHDQGEIHFMASFNFWILMFNSKRAQVQKTNRQGKVISSSHQWYQRILHMQRDVNPALVFLHHLPISRLDIINPALMVSKNNFPCKLQF